MNAEEESGEFSGSSLPHLAVIHNNQSAIRLLLNTPAYFNLDDDDEGIEKNNILTV